MGNAVDAQQLAVRGCVAGDFIMVLAAIRIRCQMFTTILEPSHRTTNVLREPAECHFFGAQQPLVPKPTADIRRNNSNIAVLEPEALAEPRLHGMRKLR